MSEYFERQRQEAEQRRIKYQVWQQEQEINAFRRKVHEIEENGYDDGDLWWEIDVLKSEVAALRDEIKQLKFTEKLLEAQEK